MLSKAPTLRAGRSSSHSLLRPLAFRSLNTGSRQLQYGGSKLTSHRSTLAPSPSPLCTSGSGLHLSRPFIEKRYNSSEVAEKDTPSTESNDKLYNLVEAVNANEVEIAILLDELGLQDEQSEYLDPEDLQFDDDVSQTIGEQDGQELEARVRIARQQFGENLPGGFLNEQETILYTRLYGESVVHSEEPGTEIEGDEMIEDPDKLFRENGQGGWEEVTVEQTESQDNFPLVYDMELGPLEEETAAMQRTREVAEQLGGQIMFEDYENEGTEGSAPRLHPLTAEGKFSPNPSTVFLPKETLTGPISIILSDFSNKHIAEAAHRAFGGRMLPHSTTTPPPRAQVAQSPIPLEASQRYMTEMEANAYLAALYPGVYASVLSVLTEVRKRLGSDWIRPLISQEGGPSVLDASAGGAGILAWRDVLRAEWELMVPDHPESAPYPLGKSTVVIGSEPLRLRASAMLENTTFLPRLPDYVHIREKPTLSDERAPPKRKQYDLIIAPHGLLGIEEEYLRKEYVENLWALLNPKGGVLVLLEKGHQKGFEAISGAREMLLKRHIASLGFLKYEDFLESPGENSYVDKEPGMIIAPCTNHEKCPMYVTDSHSKGRKDYCHFEQRYIRPPFLQRIIGAKDRNHEDVKFSYLAVQRGVDLREREGIIQGSQATDAAFEGYEHPKDETNEDSQDSCHQSLATGEHKFSPLSLPRVVYPPMKRRGHVIFDLCTPSGKIERWTVPRSYSRQAYRDARKSGWGDLWALGAKTRIPRTLKVGDKHGEGKKERLARRAAERAELEEEDEFGDEEQRSSNPPPDFIIPTRKKGQTIPSWKKHADKKKIRQASKKYSTPKEDFIG